MSVASENILFELICYTVFFCTCAGLLKSRCSKQRSALVLAGSVAVATVIQVIILSTATNAPELILTQLPLSAYLPVIVAVHILAKGGFAAAVATWGMGLLAPYTMNLFRDLIRELWFMSQIHFNYMHIVLPGSLLLGVLAFIAVRLCRKPFQMYEFQDKYVWLILPAVLLLSLVSYFQSMVLEPFATFLLFVFVLAMFVFLIKFLNVAMSVQLTRASEQELVRQLDVQRQELLRIDQTMEQSRIYRHDMRHHLSVLHELAENEKTEDIQAYISGLDAQISDLEKERYCDNTVVNAVLSTYLGKAKQEDIRTEVKVDIPKELPVDAIDICTVLANALNNAVAACSSNSPEKRWIYVFAALRENGNFFVDIKNPCDTPVEFGRDGFPVSHGGEEHGFGVRSIDATVKKYNGILRCTCDGGIFRLNAVLFSPNNVPAAAGPHPIKRLVSNTAALMLLAVCLLNFLPGTMEAAAAVPVLGNVVRILDIRTYRSFFQWGSSGLEVDLPQVSAPDQAPELPAGADELDWQMEKYVERIKDEFLHRFSRKYRGYVASDTGYNVLCNDEHLLSIQFYTTINMGGSGTYSRCFTLDKSSWTVLQLSDLFTEGSDYAGVLSAEILRQMEEQVAAGQAVYFIPGGIFSDEECFQAIDPDQNFYIDENGRLVIVFDEYEVAPGSAGMPQFTIGPETLQEILRQPSVLSPVGSEAE